MSLAGLALATVTSLATVQPTPTGLHHKFDCDKVLQLRLGQSKAQVVALLGQPWFDADQRLIWSNGQPRQDWILAYGSLGAPTRIYQGFRDEFNLDFLNDRLVGASAYRMQQDGLESKQVGAALWLGSTELGNGPGESQHDIGSLFGEFFGCGAGFSLARAQASFSVTSRARSSDADPAARARDLRAAVGAVPGRYTGVSQEYQDPPAAGLLPALKAITTVEIKADGTLAFLDASGRPTAIPWVQEGWQQTVEGSRTIEAWPRRVGAMLVIDLFGLEDGKVVGGGRWYLTRADSR